MSSEFYNDKSLGHNVGFFFMLYFQDNGGDSNALAKHHTASSDFPFGSFSTS